VTRTFSEANIMARKTSFKRITPAKPKKEVEEEDSPCNDCFGSVCPATQRFYEDRDALCQEVKSARSFLFNAFKKYAETTHLKERTKLTKERFERFLHNSTHLAWLMLEASSRHTDCCVDDFFQLMENFVYDLVDKDAHVTFEQATLVTDKGTLEMRRGGLQSKRSENGDGYHK
jgi:hypothetical protein